MKINLLSFTAHFSLFRTGGLVHEKNKNKKIELMYSQNFVYKSTTRTAFPLQIKMKLM